MDQAHVAPRQRAEERFEMAGQPEDRAHTLALDRPSHQIRTNHPRLSPIWNLDALLDNASAAERLLR
jgi:hypothetical protein